MILDKIKNIGLTILSLEIGWGKFEFLFIYKKRKNKKDIRLIYRIIIKSVFI